MAYFVAGLPRSRTAWMSVFLSQSGEYCHHDGMNGCNNISQYQEKINDGGDSSTCLHLFNINKLYPDAKIVVITKSESEVRRCIDWIDKTYNANSEGDIMRQLTMLENINGMRISQSDIDNRLQEIFEYLTGKEWVPIYAKIKELNIQADPFGVDMLSMRSLMRESIY